MHLVSQDAQQVHVAELGETYAFEPGETIHTENSYKYSPSEIAALAEEAGLAVVRRWSDPDDRFDLSLLRRS